MEKKNNQPLTKQPETMTKKVYVEGDSYRPAGDDQTEQPQDVLAELKRGGALLEHGISAGSLEDIQAGVRITTGVATVASGADPMRPVRQRATNADAIPAAMKEVLRYLPILEAENPGVLRRLDFSRAKTDMAGWDHAEEMRKAFQSRADQMDTLKRYYESEIAPTLGAIFDGCRPTIEGHSDLKSNMPELTRLAVGAQQDAAASRSSNDKLRQKTLASKDHQPAGTPSPSAPGVTTTVTTPAPGAPLPVTAPPATPARTPRGHTLKG